VLSLVFGVPNLSPPISMSCHVFLAHIFLDQYIVLFALLFPGLVHGWESKVAVNQNQVLVFRSVEVYM
jgi:hypothetical protein